MRFSYSEYWRKIPLGFPHREEKRKHFEIHRSILFFLKALAGENLFSQSLTCQSIIRASPTLGKEMPNCSSLQMSMWRGGNMQASPSRHPFPLNGGKDSEVHRLIKRLRPSDGKIECFSHVSLLPQLKAHYGSSSYPGHRVHLSTKNYNAYCKLKTRVRRY